MSTRKLTPFTRPVVTPVEERIDHDLMAGIAWAWSGEVEPFSEAVGMAAYQDIGRLARAYQQLLTEHTAREEDVQLVVTWARRRLGPFESDLSRALDRLADLPATESAQPEEAVRLCPEPPTGAYCDHGIRVTRSCPRCDQESAQPDPQQFVCMHGYRGYCQETKQAAHLCGGESAQPEEER